MFVPEKNNKYRSIVWKSFNRINKEVAKCLICNASIKISGNCSNMRKHLLSQHSSASNKTPIRKNVKSKKERNDEDEDRSAVAELAGAEATTEDDETDAETEKKPAPIKRSSVWNHFVKTAPGRVKCSHCSADFSFRDGSTSNLLKHMRARHRSKMLENGASNGADEVVTKSTAPIDTTDEVAAEVQPDSDEGDHFKVNLQNRRSNVWQYFKRLNKKTVRCNLCCRHYAYSNSTSNLRKHLKKKHDNLESMKGSGNQTVKEDNTNNEDTAADDTEYYAQDEYLDPVDDEHVAGDDVEMAASNEEIVSFFVNIGGQLDPLHSSTTELPAAATATDPAATATDNGATAVATAAADVAHGFSHTHLAGNVSLDNNLQQLLTNDLAASKPSPKYVCPFLSAVTSNHLIAKYQEVTQRISRTLQQTDNVALTVATWSEGNNPTDIYLAITAHFITRTDWRLHAVLLSCSRLADTAVCDPSAASISASIVQLMRHACAFWRITGKVFAIVSDGSPRDRDANAFGTATTLGWSRLQCLDRRLGDCIGAALIVNEFEALRLKIDSITQLFDEDFETRSAFNHFQMQSQPDGAKPQRLMQHDVGDGCSENAGHDDSSTGSGESQLWRRMLSRLQQLCDLREAIDATLELLRHDTRLSTADWMAIRDVRDLLQSFADALEELRSDTTVSTSKVIVLMHGVTAQLAAYRSSAYRTITSKEVANMLQENLRSRMADSECDLLLAVCMFLDPRFGRCGFVRKQAMRICQVHVETLASGVQGLDEEEEVDEPLRDCEAHRDSRWHWLDAQVKDQRLSLVTPETLAQHELHFYNGQLALRRLADPLQWWCDRGQVACPRLALVARKYLSLPATCANSRRALASAERLTLGGWGLDHDTLKMVLFLQENMSFYKKC